MAGPEARIPTRLVHRAHANGRTEEVRVVGPGVMSLFRVGPYDVLRGLVRAPSAWMVEARGPNGEAVLLQLAHLRGVHGKVDLLHRQHLERSIAKATAELFSEAEIQIMAHGGADREDGTRVLFWAMPWRPDMERLQNAALYVEGASHLINIAVELAHRLARRHVLGRIEPLLSEHLVLVRPSGADLLGIPVQVPPAWLAPDTPAARLAPEESLSEETTKAGDIWRLGQTLLALSTPFDAIPGRFLALLHKMVALESDRPPRATEVLVELESVRAGMERGLELAKLDSSRTSTFSAIAPEELSKLMVRCLGDSTKVDAARPLTDEIFLPRPASVSEERTHPGAAPAADVPAWAFFFDAAELGQFLQAVRDDLQLRGLTASFGTAVVQISGPKWPVFKYLGLYDLARLCHRAPKHEWPAMIARDFEVLLSATASQDSLSPNRMEPSLAVISRPRATPKPELTPTDPVKRPAASDGDTAVDHRRPTTDGVHPAIEKKAATPTPVVVDRRTIGPEVELATPVQPNPIQYTPPPALKIDPAQARISEATLIDGRNAGALSTEMTAAAVNRGRSVAAFFGAAIAIAALALGGSVLLQPAPRIASPAGEVVVDASPAGAIVISERDGRILGAAPVRFLVPEGSAPVVLIAAEGHEPQRLVLPDRGRIAAALTPLPAKVEPCAIAVDDSSRKLYEGVGARIDVGARLVVRGAAVVRVKPGAEAAGAWLVRCPQFGGGSQLELERDPVASVKVSVLAPRGAELTIDGQKLGTVPTETKVHGAFIEVTVRTTEGETISRFIPALTPLEIQMPSAALPSAMLGLDRARD